jgi:predicted porin
MKKQLIAAAVAGAFALPAMAQVTISGSINAGVMNNGQLPNSKLGVASLGGGANAININASEDLGGGLSGGATFQLRFSAATGDATSSGVGIQQPVSPASAGLTSFPSANVFHAANVFLSSAAGTVRVGKVAEDGSCGFDPWACTGGAAMMAGEGATSNATGAGTRTSLLVGAGTQANSVYYQSPAINGFRLSLQTTMGQRSGTANTYNSADLNRVNDRTVINLTYSNGPIDAQYIDIKGAQNTGASRGDDKRTEKGYGLSYNFGVAKVSLYKADKQDADGTKSADLTNVSATVPMGALTLLAGYTKNNASTALSTADTKTALGVNYALSKRTILGADVFQAEIAGGSTGYVLRARHNF